MMRHGTRRSTQRGFTLMDVLVAILVMVIGVTGLLAMQVASINANGRARELIEATQLCQDKIEQLRPVPGAPVPPLPPVPPLGYEEVDARGCVIGAMELRAYCNPPLPGPRYRRTWVQDPSPMWPNRFKVCTSWTSEGRTPMFNPLSDCMSKNPADPWTHQVEVSYVR